MIMFLNEDNFVECQRGLILQLRGVELNPLFARKIQIWWFFRRSKGMKWIGDLLVVYGVRDIRCGFFCIWQADRVEFY